MKGLKLKFQIWWIFPTALIFLVPVNPQIINGIKEAFNFMPNPNAHLTTPEIITKYGYPVQVHHVITADEYNLTVFRIPNGRNGSVSTKGPVLLQHGMFGSSDDWVLNFPNITLPFLLADEGYDVFISNIRGSNYSKSNINGLNADSNVEYWNFSFHEMGMHDTPALIDYILRISGTESLFYIGHSMGTTMFWIAMSERPEYNSRIKGMFALAPVTFLGNLSSPAVRALSPLGLTNSFQTVNTLLGQGMILSSTLISMIFTFAPTLCTGQPLKSICSSSLYLFQGYDPYQVSNSQISNVLGHYPTTASVRTFSHFLQLMNKPRQFRQYDWGPLVNLRTYRSISPPAYDLSKVTAPVYLYWGQSDLLSDPRDVALLNANLPPGTVRQNKMIEYSNWNHMDFLVGKDAGTFVYNDIISNMNALN